MLRRTDPRLGRTGRSARIGLLTASVLLVAPAMSGSGASAHGSASARRAHRHAHPHHARRHAPSKTDLRIVRRSALGAPARLFAASSVWNQPLANDAAIDPTSGTLARALAAEAVREAAVGTGPWISTSSYSTPIYVVSSAQPSVFVALDDPTAAWRVSLQDALRAVPIPAGAQPAVGTDAQMTIYQPSTDRLWELWRARKLADGWHAAWGGAIDHVSQSPGYYTTSSWRASGSYWGASATSLPLAAGTMTIADLRSGSIDHALAMDVPTPRAGVYSWPAQRSDGVGTNPADLPEGAHLRIDPSLDIRALHLPHLTEMMALAAQRYGIVVRDQTHHAIGFFGEDPTPTGSDPYHGSAGFYGGKWPADLLKSFPWGSLRVLKLDLHASPSK